MAIEAADRFRTLSVLPDWLIGALSGDEVMTALTAEVPECQLGLLAILGCKVKRLALQGTSGRWAGSYHFQLRREAGGPTETVQLSGSLTPPDGSRSESTTTVPTAFGEPGWECWLPALGLRLNVPPALAEPTQLAELLEPARAALLVQTVLRDAPGFPSHVRVRSCRPHLLGHKPGNRSVVRCDVDLEGATAGSTRRDSLVLKTYRSDKGRSAYDGMLGLWQASLMTDGAAAVARPLGYLPDRRLLAQTIVPGDETLEDFLKRALLDNSPAARAATHDRIRATARGLAALHSSGVRADKTVALDDQLADARKQIDRLTAAVAPLTPCSALEPLLRRVREDASQADPLVSSHGGFAPEQVLLADDGVGFVDFDDFCLAEPGMDTGMFAAALADLALSTDEGPSLDTPSLKSKSACFGRLDRAAELAETFLTEYESRAHLTRTRATLWHTVDVIIHAARTWTKVKPAGPMKDLLILEHHLSRLGW